MWFACGGVVVAEKSPGGSGRVIEGLPVAEDDVLACTSAERERCDGSQPIRRPEARTGGDALSIMFSAKIAPESPIGCYERITKFA
jgi:hypothetical protein